MNYEEAIRHFTSALEKQPQNPDFIEGIGYVKRRQGKFDEALLTLKTASDLDPRSAEIAFNLAETYALVRDFKEAESFYNHALHLSPTYSRAHAWKARLHISRQGDSQAARTALEEAARAIESADDSLIVYHSVWVDIMDRKYEDALRRLSATKWEAFEEQFYCVPRAQLAAQIFGLMGEKERERENYESALRYLEERIKARPDDPPLHSALGIAYAGLGLKDRAIQAAEKGVELMPVSKEAYRGIFRVRNLAQVYVMVGEYEKAFDQIEYLLSIPGELSVPLLKLDPVWAPLHTLPRFQKLLERYR